MVDVGAASAETSGKPMSRQRQGRMAEADDSLMLAILRELRADMRQHRTLLLQLSEAAHRHDRRFDDMERRFGEVEQRISDARAEIELMLKTELLGSLTHF